MALQTFILRPSADIHLVLYPPSQSSIQLEVIGYDDAVSLGSVTSNCTFATADNSIATVTATGFLTAEHEGITFLTVGYIGTPLTLVARVWVHDHITNYFLGNNSGTVNVGSDNFQPTIYAEFDSGDLEDISGHPYVTYLSLAPSFVQVDPKTGRVTGVTPGSTAGIRILEAFLGNVIGDLRIEVRESLNADRPIVERVTFKGHGPEKRNILFLAEGFSQSEEGQFKRIAREIDRRMRTSKFHQPFKLLSDDYNTWTAFEASNESGVTIGPSLRQPLNYTVLIEDVPPGTAGNYSLFELVDLIGFPDNIQRDSTYTLANALVDWAGVSGFNGAGVELGIFNAWQEIQTGERAKAKDSSLGIMYGRRLGDRFANADNRIADNTWYRAQPINRNFFYKDVRRTGTEYFQRDGIFYHNSQPILQRHWTKEFFDYLNSLKLKGSVPTDPYYNIGQKWDLDSDDQGLVIIIVNDEIHAGNYMLTPNIFGCISVGRSDLDVSSIVGAKLIDHTPNITNYFIEPLTAIVLHELCHGIFLGDEYEDWRGKNQSTLSQVPQIIWHELFHNLNSIGTVQGPNPPLNPIGSKWLITLFRIEKSSAILTDVQNGSAPNTLEIELYPNEVKKWTIGEDVFLITKNLNINAKSGVNLEFYPKSNRHRTTAKHNLTISNINGNLITVSGGTLQPNETFPKGSMIFKPKMYAGNPLGIFLPGVLNYLNNSTGNLANGMPRIDRFFSNKGGNCNAANEGLANTPPSNTLQVAIPASQQNIPGIRYRIIGMHEGGGGWNCGIVRPTAVCKMRSEYYVIEKNHFRFCHLCKYIIVQEFNPSKHAELDKDYPGEPL